MNEWSLIKGMRQGDQSAFKQIVELSKELVYNTALGILQNPEDAEDVAQEVFAQLYESIQGYKGESKLSTWLYRVTVSRAMDLIRKKKTKKRFAKVISMFGQNGQLVYDPPDFVHPGVKLDNREKSVELFKAIAQLPENQRIAFTLNRIQGLSYDEIGEIMDLTKMSVESLLHRARKNLRKILTAYYLEIRK